MDATGVSFAEQQMRRGKYYDQPAFPFVPGYDLVGTVERIGGGSADEIGVGARVAALTKVGAWADRVLLDVRDLVPVPRRSSSTASRLGECCTGPRARSGETIVVLGAAGGVGTILVQLARHAGIRVIGTAGTAQQEHVCREMLMPVPRQPILRADHRPPELARVPEAGLPCLPW